MLSKVISHNNTCLHEAVMYIKVDMVRCPFMIGFYEA